MTDNAPPEAPRSAPPHASESLRALVAPGSADEESFPVLTAFQRLLDAERERARRRTVALSAWFAGAIIVLLLVFGLLFAMFFGQMIGDGREQQRRLQEQQNALLAMVSSGRLAPGAAEALLDSRAAAPAEPASAAQENDATAAALADALRLLERQQQTLDRLMAEKTAPRAPAVRTPAPKPVKPAAAKPAARPAKPAAEKPAAAKPAAPAKPNVVVAKPAPKPAAPAAPQAPAPEPPAANVITVRPTAGMRVPDGYATDRVEVRTPSGAIVPLRTLLPTGSAR